MQYTLWLEPLRPQTLTPGLLQIAISQPFIQAWVIEHYQALIIDALLAVIGENYQVTFGVQKEGEP
jgi:chromosomal replication initiation ATPase DnaA